MPYCEYPYLFSDFLKKYDLLADAKITSLTPKINNDEKYTFVKYYSCVEHKNSDGCKYVGLV